VTILADIKQMANDINAMSGALMQVEDDMGKVKDSSQLMSKQMHYMLTSTFPNLTKEIQNQTHMFNGLIYNLQKITPAVQQTTQVQASYSKSIASSASTVLTLTKAQEALGIQLNKKGDGFVRNGLKVNEYGEMLNNAGEKVNNFNKRTALMQSLAREMNKDGEKNIGFLKGFSKYTELGGNTMEYLAEFLTSSREELTIFGMEAAKARKVLYGFAPPGTFRVLNKFSSVLQFVGGTYRKMGDDGKNAREEIKKLKKAMIVAEAEGSTEEVEAFTKQIKALEDSMNPSLVSNFFGTIMKATRIPMPKGNIFDVLMNTGKQLAGMDKTKGVDSLQDFAARFAGGHEAGDFLTGGRKKRARMVQERGERFLQSGQYAATGQSFMFGKGAKASREGFKALQEHMELYNNYIKDIISEIKEVEAGTKTTGTVKVWDEATQTHVDKQLDAEAMQEILEEQLDNKQDLEETMLTNHPYYRKMKKFQKFAMGIGSVLKTFLSFAIKMTFGFMLLALGIVAIVKVIGPTFMSAFEGMRDTLSLFFNFFYEGLNEVWEGAQALWSAVFEGGSFDEAVNAIVKIAVGLLQTAIGFIGVMIPLAVVTLGKLAYAIYKRGKEFFFSTSVKWQKKVGVALAIVVFFVATFWFKLYLFPAIIVALMVYALGKMLGFYQTGGVVNKPMQIVGEKGPEIAALPRGTRVYNNADSRRIAKSSGRGTVNNYNITINAKDTSDKEMRRIAAQIGKMINREVNRGTSSSYS
tara:strand:- start:11014 stop:13266 length:2253 start_codon:yes stop_codon:yes gene_type:complete